MFFCGFLCDVIIKWLLVYFYRMSKNLKIALGIVGLACATAFGITAFAATAPNDPPVLPPPGCGDGICASVEEAMYCPQDCGKQGNGGTTETPPIYVPTCGDGLCILETSASCPLDCGTVGGGGTGTGGSDGSGGSGSDGGSGSSAARQLLIKQILEQLVAVLTELVGLLIAQR